MSVREQSLKSSGELVSRPFNIALGIVKAEVEALMINHEHRCAMVVRPEPGCENLSQPDGAAVCAIAARLALRLIVRMEFASDHQQLLPHEP